MDHDRRSLRGLWEFFRSSLGGLWEVFGRVLGGLWEAFVTWVVLGDYGRVSGSIFGGSWTDLGIEME